ncbi:GNAT family N-acetyltransferase [Bacillus solimangrovi]|uniref:GNAT family N-acetyltransferase n=1 Tax=Bacillus solimangrovi TaxID=1305675 RepID=A0A1E5LB70_9BACI|nr:GNAT family N-acetyltransferase [Bacillus solimangrovi]OEH91340.1 GNAT family N-acetyltransferase [Bacillus solimangrovi]
MKLRKYQSTDAEEIYKLFWDTVHSVNAQDYTEEQLNVWAPNMPQLTEWEQPFLENITYVAVIDTQIVGFSDMTIDGYLNRLFVHKNFQSLGIASKLVQKLESKVKENGIKRITTDASITAKPFFERSGYRVVNEQKVEKQGIYLINYKMEKHLS